jgi:hypothetical protein
LQRVEAGTRGGWREEAAVPRQHAHAASAITHRGGGALG